MIHDVAMILTGMALGGGAVSGFLRGRAKPTKPPEWEPPEWEPFIPLEDCSKLTLWMWNYAKNESGSLTGFWCPQCAHYMGTNQPPICEEGNSGLHFHFKCQACGYEFAMLSSAETSKRQRDAREAQSVMRPASPDGLPWRRAETLDRNLIVAYFGGDWGKARDFIDKCAAKVPARKP